METLRRIVFAITVFLVASLVFSIWRRDQEGYGLLNFLRGEAPQGEKFTAPHAPKLDLKDVKILSAMNDEFSRLSAAVLPSVVSVTTKTVRRGQTAWHPFFGVVSGRAQIIPGLGSGAIISKEGHVVTNYHVIADVSEVIVTTNDNKQYPARVLGAHRERDIALLKIEGAGKDFPALSFANSDDARVGQIVFAVGNPFGLSGTVTQGIISARDRHLSDSQLDYLQTDTVINPGNSGGPLVNILGQIIGINVAIYRGDENVRAWQGVGLAVPANDVKTVVEAIRKQSKGGQATIARKGYLGLELNSESVVIDGSMGGLGTPIIGAYITDVDPQSPAAMAGLTEGDVVTAINGRNFKTPSELLQIILSLAPSTPIKLTIVRNGQLAEVSAVIGERPDAQ
ncbi:serine protease Do [Prosthecobacter fusiformis]|uniref:Serine protease Do n=1 Tax=Prosthecobacter fusiformis TaxID=48464 RepID=A0A4R7SRA1_9BACT|nr:trypsin-like peptidase domain-containing protein [Prosthecobacter fusiformis]TDU81484.1 serine protease Do [Prosthecobacter fusiformis]